MNEEPTIVGYVDTGYSTVFMKRDGFLPFHVSRYRPELIQEIKDLYKQATGKDMPEYKGRYINAERDESGVSGH